MDDVVDSGKLVVFAYSDVSHARVMHTASLALAEGADFLFLGPERTMLQAKVPVIAICVVRTGCGKSPTTRWLARRLKQQGLQVAVIRHPMPYGDLERQVVQRFANRADLDAADCTIEEREEYEPHIAQGGIIYSGVDYEAILREAEKEADVILWDGGNNDMSFYKADLTFTVHKVSLVFEENTKGIAYRVEAMLDKNHPRQRLLRLVFLDISNPLIVR